MNVERNTSQRRAIHRVLQETARPMGPREILESARRHIPGLGIATVYRTLKLLVDCGLAIERQFGDGQARYEVVGDHHDHLICVKCGLILEFEDAEIERLQERIASRLGGFTVLRHRHELYGLCPKAAGDAAGACPNDRKAR